MASPLLESVDEVLQPQASGCEQDDAEEAVGSSVVTCCDAARVLEALDARLILLRRAWTARSIGDLDSSVALGWDHGRAAASLDESTDRVRMVITIGKEHLWVRCGLLYQSVVGAQVVSFDP